ncbi:MAG: 2-oxoacid:acceptor oxidoreductase family protein [Candidatus Aenigmarchaeota archaeon]|nr:2-oxoacid:acceptor oxidoreductase family protein [Candidatus Aenigmarchaeota archaeon]
MQISIIGYDGQGVETLARTLSRAGMLAGLNSNDFCEKGSVKKAYVRIDKDVLEKGPIKNPDLVVILDSSLFSIKDLKETNIFILNTLEKPKAATKSKNLHVIDATEIALKNTGKGIPNMPIAGAVTKYFTKLQIKHVKSAIEKELNKKQKENCLAAEEGLKLVK